MTETQVFKEWAVLELMGHRRLAGEVSEATIGGAAFIRIDVPAVPAIECEGQPAFTQYYTGPAIYAITPTTEGVARKLAKAWAYQPVSKWELREIPAHAAPREEYVESDPDPEPVANDDDEFAYLPSR